MAISLVQVGTVASSPGGATSLSIGAITLAHTMLAAICWDGNDSAVVPSPPTDSLSNTYSLLTSYVNTSGGSGNISSFAVYAAPITMGGSPTTSISMTGRGGGVLLEYAGLSSTLDQFATGQATVGTTVTTTTTGTTSTAAELILVVGGTLGAGSGGTMAATSYTNEIQGSIAVGGVLAVLDQIVSSTGTFSTTVSNYPSGGFNAALLVTIPAFTPPPPGGSQSVFLIL